MMKKVILFSMLLISLSGFAQTKPIAIRAVSDSTTQLGRSFSKNTIILNEQDNSLWKALALASSSDALEDVSKALITGTNVMDGVNWGAINGSISNQTDLINLFAGKSDVSHTHAYGTLTNLPTIPSNTSQITENLNLYFTEDRTRGTLLTGLSLASSADIVAGDNFLSAFGKLQGQITALSVGGGTGDMLKSEYDSGDNGIVDNAENLNGQAAAYYLNYSNFTNTPVLATVATSGAYADLTGKPTIVDWSSSGQGTIHVSNYVDQNTTYTGSGGVLLTGTNFTANLSASHIPDLDASKITTGLIGGNRIPTFSTTKITTGVFADGRISSSSITQHQGDLSVTRSQVTDYVYQPLVIQFEEDGTVYIPIHESITYNLVSTFKTGTGTITFEKNNGAETGSTSFVATDVLEVIASGVTGYVSVTIPRTN